MILYRLLGIGEKNGDFNGTLWHNLYLYVSYVDDKNLGRTTDVLKFKFDNADSIFGFNLATTDLASLIDRDFYCTFSKNGEVLKIEFADDYDSEVI